MSLLKDLTLWFDDTIRDQWQNCQDCLLSVWQSTLIDNANHFECGMNLAQGTKRTVKQWTINSKNKKKQKILKFIDIKSLKYKTNYWKDDIQYECLIACSFRLLKSCQNRHNLRDFVFPTVQGLEQSHSFWHLAVRHKRIQWRTSLVQILEEGKEWLILQELLSMDWMDSSREKNAFKENRSLLKHHLKLVPASITLLTSTRILDSPPYGMGRNMTRSCAERIRLKCLLALSDTSN